MAHRLAVIGGDGIGPEVVAEALRVMEAAGVAAETTDFDLGSRRYHRTGEVLNDDTLADLAGYDAILLGAVGDPSLPAGLIERGLLLRMRFEFDQYINLRPFQGAGRDFVVVRENTEGVYVGEGGVLRKGTPHEVATQGSVNTRRGVERCVRFAFEQARTRPAKHLTLIHKTNVLMYSGDLWARTFAEVGEEYPDITRGYDHIDAACIHLVERPDRYDTIVTDNLFGDIITDLAGAVAGGIGLAASGNLRPERDRPSMFEPAHGSAPDIAGTGRANPLATIRSAAMLCDFLGEKAAAEAMSGAVDAVLAEGVAGSTTELGDAVIAGLARVPSPATETFHSPAEQRSTTP